MTQPNMSPLQRLEAIGSPDITLYTIADSGFFLGLIGLVNSLRITGCHHPVVVLDCGLTPQQRAVVRPHCQLVAAPPRGAINPTQYKAFAHLLQPRGIVVIIDSDIIVARSLDSILRRAVEGRICAFPDWGGRRWFPEWQQLFGLRAQLRREVYVNAGFVAWSTVHWPHLLERWWECCERTFASPTIREGAANTGPLAQADQDALNALLMSEIPAGAVALEPREAEAFRRNLPEVEILDAGTLASRFAGHPVTLLHNNGAPKLWERQAWRRVRRRNAFIGLLRRLLHGSDVEIRLSRQDLPVWLRAGLAARTATYLLGSLNLLISAVLSPRTVFTGALRARRRLGR